MSLSAERPPGGWVSPVPAGAPWAGSHRGWHIRSKTTTIGRGDDCDIQIRDPKVSRRHVELVWDKKNLFLVHRSKTNETRVMGLPVPGDQPQQLYNSTTRIELAEGIALDVQVYAAISDAATVPSSPGSRLVAVILADAVDFSRLTEADERGALDLLTKCHNVFIEQAKIHGGHLVNRPGDSVLLVFDSVVRALTCAVSTQKMLGEMNSRYRTDEKMLFRFGMTTGEVEFVRDNETGGELAYGDAINVAERIQRLAAPGQIAVSHTIRNYVDGRKDFRLEPLQEVQPKNMTKKVTVYTVNHEASREP